MENDFAVFILTHGRSNNIKTLDLLKKSWYNKSEIYLIVDNEDKKLQKYITRFGSKMIKVFDKKAMADEIDEGNNFDDRRGPIHARNACFSIAEQLSIKYFMMLEDDYTNFDYRLLGKDQSGIAKPIKNINILFDALLTFYKSCNALSIAFAQGGDFIGGINNGKDVYRFSKRKCMNSFICSTERKFRFVGIMNDDVNTYVTLGSRGHLFLTIPYMSLTQEQTQGNSNGMSDFYLKFGTYCKAFTTVMMQPSSVKVAMMNTDNPRIHHSINWKTTVPCIIDERYKKTKTFQ